jgi:oxygen-independent coproporphyrinogen-3 oxidase
MRLMCDHALDYDQLSGDLGIDFKAYFADELDSFTEMEHDGLLTTSDNKLQVTPQGTLFIRNIAMHFDAHLAQSAARHSKTV